MGIVHEEIRRREQEDQVGITQLRTRIRELEREITKMTQPVPGTPGPPPSESPQRPSVGRIVHYVAYGTPGGEYTAGAHRAAIVTEVYPDDPMPVGLFIFNPTGMHVRAVVPYDPTGTTPGTWHWPERA